MNPLCGNSSGIWAAQRALDRLLGNMQGVGEAQGEDGIKGWLSQRIQAMLQTKQLLAVSRLKPGDENHTEQLLRLLSQGQRAKGNPADSPRTALKMHVQAMMNDILWAVGPTDVPPPLQEWKDTGCGTACGRRNEIDGRHGSAGVGRDKGLEDPLGTGYSPRRETQAAARKVRKGLGKGMSRNQPSHDDTFLERSKKL